MKAWRDRRSHCTRAELPRPLRLILALAAVLAVSIWGTQPGAAQEVPELQITSTHYIVVDADTGEIFAQRRAQESVPMASLTKVFTAIEAIETAPPGFEITTTADDLVDAEATTMGFGPGETFTVDELIYGMMLPSGNDAAQAIARALGGPPGTAAEEAVAGFIARLNERIRNMGLTETNLINPDGWGVPDHRSSAHDLAAFTMYALRYPRFVEAISTETYQAGDGAYLLTNTNKLLGSYDGLIGGKTGYDDDAGWCLIEVAERDGSTMIAVTLDGVAPDDWYDDNRVLLDYAFEQKAARAAAGTAGSGERVGYLDPDAALIARIARPGQALGLPVPPATDATDQAAAAPELDPETALSPVPIASPRGVQGPALIVLAVAAVLILGQTLRAFRGYPRPLGRATPALRPQSTPRHSPPAVAKETAELRGPEPPPAEPLPAALQPREV